MHKLLRYTALACCLAVMAFVTNYYHLLERGGLFAQERMTSEQERKNSVWLDDYRVVIQGKRLEGLEQAEVSGLSWDAGSDTLYAVTAKIPGVFQLSLDGEILRHIPLKNFSDTEGIEVIAGNRLALVEERSAKLSVFDIPGDNQPVDALAVSQHDLGSLYPELVQPNNKGLEGLAWDAARSELLLVKERDPFAVYRLPYWAAEQKFAELKKLDGKRILARDLSSLTLDPRTGHLLLLSDESHLVLEMDADAELEPVSFMSLLRGANGLERTIRQAEGISIDDDGRIYVVSEPDLFYVYEPRDCCAG